MAAAPHLVVRADAVPGLGAGHVARQLALSQAWRDRGGSVTLVADDLPQFWRDRFGDEGAAVVTPDRWWSGPPPPAGPGDWAAVDGYRYPADERSAWRGALGHLLVVDDHGLSPASPADVLLDQNLGAEGQDQPSAGPGTRRLLGPRYALLRREFRAASPGPEPGPGPVGAAHRVAIGWGGAPTDEVRRRFGEVAAALAADGLEVVALEGVDVAEALAGVDLVVTAAGTITWEVCALGRPAVLVPVADNQEPVAERMGRAGAAEVVSGGDAASAAAIVDAARALAAPGAAERRAALGRAARALVDGLGAVRVVTHLRAGAIELRPVVAGDARLLWEWANDREVRGQAFSTAEIPWDDHRAWLEARLADPGSSLYVASDAEGPVGHIRFAAAPAAVDGLEVSVALAPIRRGEHLGAALIEAGVRQVFAERPEPVILARVKPTNIGSQRAFLAADFDADGTGSGEGHKWLRYTRRRHGVASRSGTDG